ncbi:hypothetical protein NP233_g8828 [Leucocoprinus birnbaumii]|uniref:Uncharacterized protein n=1 Tax=Leucocoprinus birnbaumii TaxID=56174 RepID=A0AAD5YTC8_9AGAR|nr:hypothetical protein NP233_g8828 [Leucocoprinus birnbaumii]
MPDSGGYNKLLLLTQFSTYSLPPPPQKCSPALPSATLPALLLVYSRPRLPARPKSLSSEPEDFVAVAQALKNDHLVTSLSLCDFRGIPGVAADVSHVDTSSERQVLGIYHRTLENRAFLHPSPPDSTNSQHLATEGAINIACLTRTGLRVTTERTAASKHATSALFATSACFPALSFTSLVNHCGSRPRSLPDVAPELGRTTRSSAAADRAVFRTLFLSHTFAPGRLPSTVSVFSLRSPALFALGTLSVSVEGARPEHSAVVDIGLAQHMHISQ